ncbi:hypothetical protein NITHO_5160031 [Nitrolancea hollandica Lb]|uniref:Uncharacterized protein n=1 Tax=Nitrolancea hollandica Lb TaxID=1129897 RepID=I4ELM5_9BACT|nr:hypothetical protein NITHO_5160031 [Nitrolancea hollandica Lb]
MHTAPLARFPEREAGSDRHVPAIQRSTLGRALSGDLKAFLGDGIVTDVVYYFGHLADIEYTMPVTASNDCRRLVGAMDYRRLQQCVRAWHRYVLRQANGHE